MEPKEQPRPWGRRIMVGFGSALVGIAKTATTVLVIGGVLSGVASLFGAPWTPDLFGNAVGAAAIALCAVMAVILLAGCAVLLADKMKQQREERDNLRRRHAEMMATLQRQDDTITGYRNTHASLAGRMGVMLDVLAERQGIDPMLLRARQSSDEVRAASRDQMRRMVGVDPDEVDPRDPPAPPRAIEDPSLRPPRRIRV